MSQSPNASFTKEYANGGSATFTSPNLPTWLQVVGAGTVVVTNSDGSTGTFHCSGGEALTGEWTALVSTTATYVRMGCGCPIPPAVQGGINVTPVNLAGGTGSVTGVLPGANYQSYADGGTAATSAFTASVGYMHKITVTGATFLITLPAISSTNAGQRIAIVNVGTGTTATVIAGTGTDSIGNTSASSITAAGPTAAAVKVYVADNTIKAWLLGI